jgi:teichoic acid transport system permease protein
MLSTGGCWGAASASPAAREVALTRGAEAVPSWQPGPANESVGAGHGDRSALPPWSAIGQPGSEFQPPTQPGSGEKEPFVWLPPRGDENAVPMTAVLADQVAAQQPQVGFETAVLPKVLEPPDQAPSLVELASRHGLSPAGTRPGLGTYTQQIWRFREFIGSYANGRVIASFGTARLGRLWQVLTPILNAAVYYLIFGVVLDTRRGVPNFIAYLCIGVFIFTFMQTVVQSGVQSISGQLGLVRALQFPRAALPIATFLTQLQSLLISMFVLLGIVYVTEDRWTVQWAYLVPTLILQSFFSLGLAFFIARIGVQLPDTRQLMPYVMRTWMYASGVFYSAQVFAKHLPPLAATVIGANPMLVYIDLARHSLLASAPLSSPPGQLWLLAGAWALVTFVTGYIYFWRGEPGYGRG